MRDYIELGPTPAGEDCEQLGPNYSSVRAGIECALYVNQLQRLFPDCDFSIKRFPHDFGTYMEVVVNFEDENEEETRLAYDVDAGIPESWDEIALEQLEKQMADWSRII